MFLQGFGCCDHIIDIGLAKREILQESIHLPLHVRHTIDKTHHCNVEYFLFTVRYHGQSIPMVNSDRKLIKALYRVQHRDSFATLDESYHVIL